MEVGVFFVLSLDALSIHSLVASLEASSAGFAGVSTVGAKAQGPIVSAWRTLRPPHHVGLDLGIRHQRRKLPSSGVDEPVGDLV